MNGAGGTTTTYLIPTADLPLLRPLKNLGVQQNVIDGLEKFLRPIIDSAYIRNDAVRNTPPSVGTAVRPGARTGTAAPTAAGPSAAATKSLPVRVAAAKATAGPAGTRAIRATSSRSGPQ